jgi:prophage regulatory protein
MTPTLQKFLKLPEVIEITGKSRSSIFSSIQKGCFPAPLKIGPKAIAWATESIRQWQESCIAAANQ